MYAVRIGQAAIANFHLQVHYKICMHIYHHIDERHMRKLNSTSYIETTLKHLHTTRSIWHAINAKTHMHNKRLAMWFYKFINTSKMFRDRNLPQQKGMYVLIYHNKKGTCVLFHIQAGYYKRLAVLRHPPFNAKCNINWVPTTHWKSQKPSQWVPDKPSQGIIISQHIIGHFNDTFLSPLTLYNNRQTS